MGPAVGSLTGSRWIGRRIDRGVERLSLRAKLAVLGVLGTGFAVAVAGVGIVGLGHLSAAGGQSSQIEAARELHLAADRRLDTLRADVLSALIATPDGAVADTAPGALARPAAAAAATAAAAAPAAAATTAAAAGQAAAAAAQLLRDGISDLGGRPLADPGIARQIVLFDQHAIATAGLALDIVAAAGTSHERALALLPAFQASFAAARAATELLTQLLATRAAAAATQAHAAHATARLRILLAAGLGSLLLLAATLLLSSAVLRVLRRIGEAAAAVSGGHLSARARVRSHDEIGRLGAAFDDVADSLTSLLVQMESDAKRADFGRQLGESMEMVDDEQDVYRVIARAFEHIDEEAPMELLIADSSRAHLMRSAESPSAGPAGCAVVSPYSCVAVRKGVATTFDTSEALNACPKLRDREAGPCSALCVPISFMGRSLGVLHTTGPAGLPPGPEVQRQLITLARHAGMRVGTVRAFAKTELQASTDGLTGLLNRRALENQVRDLIQTGRRFALVMVDLDRFKNLNDTYGHEAGDRALRQFAQVLRETVRGDDIAGRLGGEEFVVAMPDIDVASALPALERIRAALADAVGGGTGPAFTASFGVTDSSDGEGFAELLRIADAGLLRAKAEGRNRIVVGTPADAAELVSRAA